jgi:hypothetical protein
MSAKHYDSGGKVHAVTEDALLAQDLDQVQHTCEALSDLHTAAHHR